IFRDIFQICPRVHGQDFDELPTDEDIVSFFKERGHTWEITSITNFVVDQMHQPCRTFATIINRSLSGKITGLDKLQSCLSLLLNKPNLILNLFPRFRMDKRKKFDLNFEIFRDIFQICPRVHGQDFDELPTDEDILSFFKERGHTWEISSITNFVVDQMHQPCRTFATIINRSLSGKITGLDKLRLSRAQILW
nr:hypothetical protein [Tanacetum cinerariifolium]